MIVPMKKAVLFVMEKTQTAALQKLKRLGLLHIDAAPRPSESLERVVRDKDNLERALLALPEEKKKKRRVASVEEETSPDELAQQILSIKDEMDAAADEVRKLTEELHRLEPWGEIDPARLHELRAHRVYASLHELTRKDWAALPADVHVFRISEARGVARVLIISFLKEVDLPFKSFKLPAESTTALRVRLERKEEECRGHEQALAALAVHRPALERALDAGREAVEFESVRLSMQADDRIVYLGGFIPVTAMDTLKEAAREEGWGLLFSDPAPDEDVPTLIKNNRVITLVRPVFEFLGTVPGYVEKDISLFFLVFFSIFYGMIVGDAAYGFIFLGISFIIRLLQPKTRAKSQFASLLMFTSAATIIWGAMTGTWFGLDTSIITATPPFSWFVVAPLVHGPNYDPTKLLMHLCLIIGVIHLTLAHIWAFLGKWPGLKCWADVGWIGVIWGGYFLIRFLVLKMDLFLPGMVILGVGFLIVVLFSEQEGKTIRGMLLGLVKMPFTFLSGVSAMADIISYVRLFALGLAGVKVEEAFNSIAAGMGFGFPNILGSGLILLFGHALNLMLGIMSILVHAVRLNMLEFSGHLGLEWSGREYKPFK